MSEPPQEARRTPKKGRSPSYPAINLESAISRAESLYAHEKMHSAPIGAIVGHWGYKSHTSGIASTQYAALKKFGLLDDEGSHDNRQGHLTSLAYEILHNPHEDERLAAIQKAALTPPIHREMWSQYGLSLPSDATLRYRLVTERGFTDAGADDFVKQYKATIAFAMPEGELLGDDALPDVSVLDGDDTETPTPQQSFTQRASSSGPVRPTTMDGWFGGGERALASASEPRVSSRTSRHAIPLIGGKQVVLEGEFPLTEEAWAGFMTILAAFKPGLVRNVEPSTSDMPDD